MSSLKPEVDTPLAIDVTVKGAALSVDLADGRTIAVPTEWFPRLSHGTAAETSNWRLIAGGRGIHWPLLDEDISVDALLAGRKSGEKPASLAKWLSGRPRAKPAKKTR